MLPNNSQSIVSVRQKLVLYAKNTFEIVLGLILKQWKESIISFDTNLEV